MYDSVTTNLLLLLVLLLQLLTGLALWHIWRAGNLNRSIDHQALLERISGRLIQHNALLDRLDLHHGIPYTRWWSATPDLLHLLVDQLLARRPLRVVECGSGLSTLVLARVCHNIGAELHSLESDDRFISSTRSYLDLYQLTGDSSSLHHAPLIEHEIAGEHWRWYRYDKLPAAGIGLLLIDGPVGRLHRHARYPALPLLHDRLADGCLIVLDDADRADEREIVERWLKEFPGLVQLPASCERGCVVLEYHCQPGS